MQRGQRYGMNSIFHRISVRKYQNRDVEQEKIELMLKAAMAGFKRSVIMEKMMMPAYYNVLSTEEMTYTEGGANATMSEALLCWLIPPYGWFKGLTAVRNYRRKNPNTWTETGLDALTADMEKSTANAIRDIACTAYMISSTATGVGLIINAAVILL